MKWEAKQRLRVVCGVVKRAVFWAVGGVLIGAVLTIGGCGLKMLMDMFWLPEYQTFSNERPVNSIWAERVENDGLRVDRITNAFPFVFGTYRPIPGVHKLLVSTEDGHAGWFHKINGSFHKDIITSPIVHGPFVSGIRFSGGIFRKDFGDYYSRTSFTTVRLPGRRIMVYGDVKRDRVVDGDGYRMRLLEGRLGTFEITTGPFGLWVPGYFSLLHLTFFPFEVFREMALLEQTFFPASAPQDMEIAIIQTKNEPKNLYVFYTWSPYSGERNATLRLFLSNYFGISLEV